MDNYNGQSQFNSKENMQPGVHPSLQQNVQSAMQPNMQMNMQPGMQPNMQMMQPNMYQQPNMQNGVYMKPKSNALMWVLIVIAALIIVVFGTFFALTACVGAAIGGTIIDAVDETQYDSDTGMFINISTAVKTFVADPASNYVDGQTYTLTELMDSDNDTMGIIKPILLDREVIEDSGSSVYKLYCVSDVFEDTTTDDVLVSIDDGSVSIYIPANMKYRDEFDSFKYGNAFKNEP